MVLLRYPDKPLKLRLLRYPDKPLQLGLLQLGGYLVGLRGTGSDPNASAVTCACANLEAGDDNGGAG